MLTTRAFAFGMASLGQLGIGLCVDEGVEVGRIKGQGTQADVKLLDEPRAVSSCSIIAIVEVSR